MILNNLFVKKIQNSFQPLPLLASGQKNQAEIAKILERVFYTKWKI
jgi:hypothetical protein